MGPTRGVLARQALLELDVLDGSGLAGLLVDGFVDAPEAPGAHGLGLEAVVFANVAEFAAHDVGFAQPEARLVSGGLFHC